MILNSVLPTHDYIAYGFSACRIAKTESDNKSGNEISNNKLPNGIISHTAPFRRKLCGFGMGFWIKRKVFDALGPIDETLATNEDTEYVCRLIDAGKAAWFNAHPVCEIINRPAATLRDVISNYRPNLANWAKAGNSQGRCPTCQNAFQPVTTPW